MSTGWWPKKIHCPNCNYDGYARLKGAGCLNWITLLGLLFVSFLFWPLFIITTFLFLYLLLKPSRQNCPKCGWKFPIPSSHYKQRGVARVFDERKRTFLI
jgi:hypothetical protein